ncbi:MAG: hypothetical protein ACP5E3_15175 [Bacteroidales bacterium]
MSKFIFIFLFINSGFVIPLSAQINSPDDANKQIAFADYLFNTQQYDFAAEEYLKLVFLYPENAILKKRTLESFRLDMDLESGLYFSRIFFDADKNSSLTFYNEIVKIKMIAGKSVLSDNLFPDSTKFRLKYYESQLLDYMLALDWEQVDRNANKIKESELYLFTQNTPENEYLSPFLAASLSAIIPGSGKVYAKRWKDGVSSFLLVGLTAFQAYRGFDRSGTDSVYGWIMGGLSAGFYLGNIYGSFKAAKNYNNNLNVQFKDRVVNYYIDHY